jgi:lipopolysaccharide export system protein LptC
MSSDWDETPEISPGSMNPGPVDPGSVNPGSAKLRDSSSTLAAPRRVFKRKKRNPWLLALKIALPTIAIAGIVYVVIWWRDATNNTVLHPLEVTDGTGKAASVNVAKVKYDGVDANNRAFSITAESATQPDSSKADNGDASRPQFGGLGGDDSDSGPAAANSAPAAASSANPPPPNLINLNHLIADITMADGAWVAVIADNGVYNRDTGIVDLSGNVNLFHDTGLSFETDAATVDVHNDSARGDQPIEGQRPNSEIVADGFDMKNNGRIVTFTGRAFLKLYPKSKTSQQNEASPDQAPQKVPAGTGSSGGNG